MNPAAINNHGAAVDSARQMHQTALQPDKDMRRSKNRCVFPNRCFRPKIPCAPQRWIRRQTNLDDFEIAAQVIGNCLEALESPLFVTHWISGTEAGCLNRDLRPLCQEPRPSL